MTLYSGADENQHGASLYAVKTTIRADLRIKVQTMNIGTFLLRLNRDIAVLKINAEGAEYEILESIGAHFGFLPIHNIWVEDHAEKIVSKVWHEQKERVLSRLGDRIIPWKPELLEAL